MGMVPSKAMQDRNSSLEGYGLGGLDWQPNARETAWLAANMPGILAENGIQGDYNDPTVRGQYYNQVALPNRENNWWIKNRGVLPYIALMAAAPYAVGALGAAGTAGGTAATGAAETAGALTAAEAAGAAGTTAGALGTAGGATGALGAATATLAPITVTGTAGGLGSLGALGAVSAGAGALSGLGGAEGVDPGVDTSTAGDGTHETPPKDAPTLAQRAGAYVQDPKNMGTIIKGVSALGALGAAGAQAPGGPPSRGGYQHDVQLAPLPQFKDPGDIDYFTYGERPEVEFYKNSAPQQPRQTPTGLAVQPGLNPQGLDDRGALGQYSHGNLVRGPGTGRSDDIPAQLSDGEYVMDAETVALLGDGSTDEGARKLDEMRARLRKHKGQMLAKGEFSADAKSPLDYIGGR